MLKKEVIQKVNGFITRQTRAGRDIDNVVVHVIKFILLIYNNFSIV